MFGNVETPLHFWTVVRDNGITVKGIAENLHKIDDEDDLEILIGWILHPNSDWYIRKLYGKNDPNKIRSLLFNYCVTLGYYREVKQLINRANVNPGTFHNIALRDAVEKNDLKMVKILLRDERVDPTDVNFFPIRMAIDQGNHMVLSQLIFNQNTIDKLDEDTVRKWRDKIRYGTPIWDILSRFIDRANRSVLYEETVPEREFKRVKDQIFL